MHCYSCQHLPSPFIILFLKLYTICIMTVIVFILILLIMLIIFIVHLYIIIGFVRFYINHYYFSKSIFSCSLLIYDISTTFIVFLAVLNLGPCYSAYNDLFLSTTYKSLFNINEILQLDTVIWSNFRFRIKSAANNNCLPLLNPVDHPTDSKTISIF